MSRRSRIALGALILVVAAVTVAGVVHVVSDSGPARPRKVETTGPAADTTDGGGWNQLDLAVGGIPHVVADVALVAPGAAIAGNDTGSAALDVRTGRVLWRIRDPAAPSELGSTQPIGFTTSAGPVAVELELAGRRETVLLVAREARTGKVRWSTPLGSLTGVAAPYGPPMACGRVICLQSNGRDDRDGLEVLDPATGHVRWTHAGQGRIVVANSSMIVQHAVGSTLVAYAVADGHRLWSLPTPSTDVALNPESTEDVGVNWYVLGSTLIASVDSTSTTSLTGVDLRSGKVAWRRPGWSFAGLGQPTVDDDGMNLALRTVLAVGPAKRLAAVSATGSAVWTVVAAPAFAHASTGARIGWSADGEVVWVADDPPALTEGRSTRTGQRVSPSSAAGRSAVWNPHDDQPGDNPPLPRVELLGPLRYSAPAPAWAGQPVDGRVLVIDRDGGLFNLPAA